MSACLHATYRCYRVASNPGYHKVGNFVLDLLAGVEHRIEQDIAISQRVVDYSAEDEM